MNEAMEMKLNIVDLVLILAVVVGIAQGWAQGLIRGIGGVVRWIGSLLLALALYEPVARWIQGIAGWSEGWARPLAFLLLVMISTLLFHQLEAAALRRIPRRLHRSPVNRVLGVLPGLLNGGVMAAVLAAFSLAAPLPPPLQAEARESELASRFAAHTERIEGTLTQIFGEAVARSLITRTPAPHGGFTRLPVTVSRLRPRPDLEGEMLALVNRERRRHGLSPLERDPELLPVARAHSADMFRRGYFSHFTPEKRDPFDRMRLAGVNFRVAGENLALSPTIRMAHEGLMNSPGHRANILSPKFGRVAIGVQDGGLQGLMVTQAFRN